MKITDMHSDTLMLILKNRKEGKVINLYSNNLMLDLERMKKSNYAAQIFACFVDMGNPPITKSYFDDVLSMIKILKTEAKNYSECLSVATDKEGYIKNKKDGKITAFISVEEGGIIGKNLENLSRLYDEGVRVITLTWNYENSIGFPNHNWKYQKQGLKKLGIEVVEYMDELGIVVDVSHLSDGGFYDVVKYGKKPFLATHSNCRAIINHPRNLTDDMIKNLANRGGIAGINYCATFLSYDNTSKISSMIENIKHFIKIGGEDVVALGSDFDGISPKNLELKGAQSMPELVMALEKEGFTENKIEKICYKNFESFLENYSRI